MGSFDAYNAKKLREGFTEDELAAKRRAGSVKTGPASKAHKAANSKAKLEQYRNHPVWMECENCGHKQKRSPNYYRYHGKNCEWKAKV